MSHELRSLLRESVPYVKIYRYNPKQLCSKLKGYGDNGKRKVWTSWGCTHYTCQLAVIYVRPCVGCHVTEFLLMVARSQELLVWQWTYCLQHSIVKLQPTLRAVILIVWLCLWIFYYIIQWSVYSLWFLITVNSKVCCFADSGIECNIFYCDLWLWFLLDRDTVSDEHCSVFWLFV